MSNLELVMLVAASITALVSLFLLIVALRETIIPPLTREEIKTEKKRLLGQIRHKPNEVLRTLADPRYDVILQELNKTYKNSYKISEAAILAELANVPKDKRIKYIKDNKQPIKPPSMPKVKPAKIDASEFNAPYAKTTAVYSHMVSYEEVLDALPPSIARTVLESRKKIARAEADRKRRANLTTK